MRHEVLRTKGGSIIVRVGKELSSTQVGRLDAGTVVIVVRGLRIVLLVRLRTVSAHCVMAVLWKSMDGGRVFKSDSSSLTTYSRLQQRSMGC